MVALLQVDWTLVFWTGCIAFTLGFILGVGHV